MYVLSRYQKTKFTRSFDFFVKVVAKIFEVKIPQLEEYVMDNGYHFVIGRKIISAGLQIYAHEYQKCDFFSIAQSDEKRNI